MKIAFLGWFVAIYLLAIGSAVVADEQAESGVMQGFPPARETQATMKNYREHPLNQWTFRNAGAPLKEVIIHREDKIRELPGPFQSG